jgi:YVTN family beta-propeller protein
MKHYMILTVLLTASTAFGQDKPALLLIGNKSEDTLSFVDVRTLKEVSRTTTGRGPHEVAVTPDGKTAFVSNYEGPGDTISVVDVPARKELHRIPLGEHHAPHGLAVSRDGAKVYATCERSQTVIELEAATGKILRSFRTDQKGTHMLVLTPDGKKLYTGNMGSGSSTVIDLIKGEVLVQIKTGANCEGVDITPDGRQVWTTNNADDGLSVIDTSTDKVVATIPCKGFPIRVKFAPDGKRALVPCARSNELAVFDVAERKEINRVSTGAFPVGVLIEPGGARAYVAWTADNTLAVYDLQTLTVMGKIAAGKQADGMALVSQR